MTCNTPLIMSTLCLLCINLLVSAAAGERFTLELTVQFFSDVSMICDHPDLNISQQNDVRSLVWMFPDGTLIDTSRRPDPKLFRLSGLSDNLDAYNLTALDINDAVFGYYTCVVVYNSKTKPIQAIRWGLNVEGADFTELMLTYRDNATVGAIAAAAMLVALLAVCVLWQFRFSNRQRILQMHLEEKFKDGDVCDLPDGGCHNQSFMSELQAAEVRLDPEADGNSIRVKM